MAHFLISPRTLLVKINLIFSAFKKKYIFQKENRPTCHMSNPPFQQDTTSVIASVGPSIGTLALKSPVCSTTHTWIYWTCQARSQVSSYSFRDTLSIEKLRNSHLHGAESLSLIVRSFFCRNTLFLLGIEMVTLNKINHGVIKYIPFI